MFIFSIIFKETKKIFFYTKFKLHKQCKHNHIKIMNYVLFLFQTVGEDSVEDTLNLMPDMISNASMVHGRVNTLFMDNDILNLP